MKKKSSTILGVVIVLVVIVIAIFAWFMSTKNSLIRQQEEVNSAYSKVDVQLQRRLELIPNLVNTVKGYASHEQAAIEAVTTARTKIGSAQTTSERVDAENELTGSLSRLLAIAENYPDLKADENFRQLSDELAGTENRIAVARTDYNEVVKQYNSRIRSFPASIIANKEGMQPLPYFEAAPAAQTAPTVDFSN